MYRIEQLAKTLSEKISAEITLNDDQKEVVAYGIVACLQTIFSFGLIVIFALIFNVLPETLIVAFSISILRKYSGGAHASSPTVCAVIGTIIAVGVAAFSTYVVQPFLHLWVLIVIILVTFALAFYLIYKLAPIDSPQKPIKTTKKKHRLKIASLCVVVVYLLIITINIFVYLKTNIMFFNTISFCICLGMTWQVFTLTRGGHLIFIYIDAIIKSHERRRNQ